MRPACLLMALLLAGCATYQPLSLPDRPALARDPAHVEVDVSALPTAALNCHRYDPRDGFDMTELAMLAIAHNPDLVAQRAAAGVTRAQAFSAGLLPDPQFALSRDSVMGDATGASAAYTLGLTVDVAALLARSSTRAAGVEENRQSDLNLLWQEWQTVAKARLLFVKLNALAQSTALLDEQRDLLQPRLDRTRLAVERGLVASDVATPQLTALQDVQRQRNDLERQVNQARHDLNALLGLAPDVVVTLVGAPDLPVLDGGQVGQALADAGRRRPDLLALQAGYAAEDDRYRGALRAQFPAITVGPNRARDTSDVNTVGFSFGIALPLFNRNRGNIAIELATREKLRLEYQQRLDTTAGEAHRLLAEDAILERQRVGIDAAIADLAQVADRARTAFTARSIDALTLTNAEAALLAKRLERVAIEQARWEQAIALQALVGTDFNLPPSADPSTDATT